MSDSPLPVGCDTSHVLCISDFRHIRLRPGMYVGDTGIYGVHQLLWEIVTNSVAEARLGECNRIVVELLPEQGCRVTDNGRGIYLDLVPEYQKPFFECVLSHSCVSLPPNRDRTYRTVLGVHRVGLLVVNSLSRRFEIQTYRDGAAWAMCFESGLVVQPLTQVKATQAQGTVVTFWYDPVIFQNEALFETQRIAERLAELAAFFPSLTLELIDRRETEPEVQVFLSPNGLTDYLREQMLRNRPLVHHNIFQAQERDQDYEVSVALGWIEDVADIVRSYANAGLTINGGTAVTGLYSGLTQSLRQIIRESGLAEADTFEAQDYSEGLVAIVTIHLPAPIFISSTRKRLGNPEAVGMVERLVCDNLPQFLRNHPEDVPRLIARFNEARLNRVEGLRDPATGVRRKVTHTPHA